MHIILVTDDHQLITSTRERIMERSKNVDELCFLTNPIRQGVDMSGCTAIMEYLSPISHEHHTELLTLSPELYKEKLMYKLPIDTKLTKEHGDVEVTLTFTKLDMDAYGNTKPYVRKTSSVIIPIIPISAWTKVDRDDYLNVIDMALLQIEGVAKTYEEAAKLYDSRKADTIVYNEEGSSIELHANGEKISEAEIPELAEKCNCKEGSPAMVL